MTSSADNMRSPRGTNGPHPYLTLRAMKLHVTLLVLTLAFIALCWWQVLRAVSGNDLSWAYVFEWPLFGAYAVYMWWKLLHETVPTTALSDEPDGDGSEKVNSDSAASTVNAAASGSGAHGAESAEDAESEDPDLAAYNRYLAELGASGRRKHW
jgi:hypothetical protein